MFPGSPCRARIAAALLLTGGLFAQTPGEDLSWRAGARFTRRVEEAAPDTMGIRLSAGQFVRVEVMQTGSDLVVTFRDPQGASIEVDSANGRYGPETVVAIAETAGEYQLQVRLDNPRDSANTYEVAVRELRTAEPRDRETVAAYRDYVEGYKLWERHNAEARTQSLEKLGQALEYFRGVRDGYMTALTLFTLGAAQADAGDFRKAAASHEEAAQLFHAAGDPHGEATALNNFAGALDVLGNLPEALRIYRQALSLFAASGDRSHQALLHNNIGLTETNLAKWQDALQDYAESLGLARQAGDRSVEAQVLNNTGVTYANLGDPERALVEFEQALPLRRAVGDKRGEATTLGALANVYLALNQPDKAVQYLEQALPLWRSLGDPRGEARALILLGRANAESKHFEEARRGLLRAVDLGRASQDRRTIGRALIDLGRASLLEGEAAQAADWSAQALVEFRAIGDRNNEVLALETAARAEEARGNLTAARDRMAEALRLNEENRTNADSEQLRASFFATRQDSYGFYIDVLMRLHETGAALEASERSRARSMLDMLADTDIRTGVDPKLLEREREITNTLNAKGSRLLPMASTNPQAAGLQQEIRDLEAQYQDVEAAIRKNSPGYAALAQPSPLKVSGIQQELLDEDSLLLEYSLGSERSYLWAVGKHELHAFELPARDAIEAQVEQVVSLLTARSVVKRLETPAEKQRRIAAADAALEAAARELSRMVIAPAAAVLGGKMLVVVPDGALQRLPFSMLPVRGAEPLIVAHEVVMLPSASALAVLRPQIAARKPASKMLAVFADPVFDRTDARAGKQPAGAAAAPTESTRILEHLEVPGENAAAGLKIPRLPYTAQEADQILSVAGNGAHNGANLKAVGFQANRAAATSGQLSDYRYLHFATHGYLDTERPSLSALVLSQIDENNQPEDGFLRVNDIYNSRLSAELVVLSACQTGLGQEVRGEGLMGLTRAFLYAGAPRVIVSLWNVNDRATAALMTNLYRSMLREGKRPAAALRQAQLEMRKQKQWESPYYWAAFVEHGEWR